MDAMRRVLILLRSGAIVESSLRHHHPVEDLSEEWFEKGMAVVAPQTPRQPEERDQESIGMLVVAASF
jgi:hypothetical protein